MSDPTENIRRAMVEEINSKPSEKEILEEKYGEGNVWDTQELQKVFQVHGFMAPFVSVTRKEDGKKGAVMFQDWPRFYFDFKEV